MKINKRNHQNKKTERKKIQAVKRRRIRENNLHLVHHHLVKAHQNQIMKSIKSRLDIVRENNLLRKKFNKPT